MGYTVPTAISRWQRIQIYYYSGFAEGLNGKWQYPNNGIHCPNSNFRGEISGDIPLNLPRNWTKNYGTTFPRYLIFFPWSISDLLKILFARSNSNFFLCYTGTTLTWGRQPQCRSSAGTPARTARTSPPCQRSRTRPSVWTENRRGWNK